MHFKQIIDWIEKKSVTYFDGDIKKLILKCDAMSCKKFLLSPIFGPQLINHEYIFQSVVSESNEIRK